MMLRWTAGLATLPFAVGCFSPNVQQIPGNDSGDSSGAGTAAATGDVPDGTTGPTDDSASSSPATSDPTASTDGSDSTGSGNDSSSGGEPAVCGDGEVEGDEVCDDGVNDGGYGSCAVDCSALGPHCGDGELGGPEVCDDGNGDNGDGCNLDCVVSGTVLWTRTYAGDGDGLDRAFGVVVAPDDGLVVAGSSVVSGVEADVLLLKYSSDGSLQWDAVHDLGDDSLAAGVAIDPDGNIGIAGALGTSQFLVAMFDGDGEELWSLATADVGGQDLAAFAASFDDAGNLYAAGHLYTGSYDVIVRRHTSLGAQVWEDVYDGGLQDGGYGCALGGDALFVAGATGITAQERNGWLRRYDLDGGIVWTREFAGANEANDEAYGVAVDPAGFVVAAGRTVPDAPGLPQGWLRKYDLDGAEIWTVLYDAGFASAALRVAIDGAGQIAVVGEDGTEPSESIVVKHAADGTQLWFDLQGAIQPFGVSGIAGVAIDGQSNVVVAGSNDADVWVRKYAP